MNLESGYLSNVTAEKNVSPIALHILITMMFKRDYTQALDRITQVIQPFTCIYSITQKFNYIFSMYLSNCLKSTYYEPRNIRDGC